MDEIKDDNEEYEAYNFDGTISDCPYPSSMTIAETEMKMYNLFKEKGLLKNENLICKEVARPETSHEVENYSDYVSDLSKIQ